MGRVGETGRVGWAGRVGESGRSGADGQPGHYGAITWRLISPEDGHTIFKTKQRFELTVEDYEVMSDVNDGVYEPNMRIFVENVQIRNTGGMPCPEGAELLFKSTATVNFIEEFIPVPELKPNENFVVKKRFSGRIKDVSSPNSPGTYAGKAEVLSRVQMLNRPFDSGLLKKTISVSYPVKIKNVLSPLQLGRNEQGSAEITIINSSMMVYGSALDTGGFVELRVHLDKRLRIAVPQSKSDAYSFKFDPSKEHYISVTIIRIEPKKDLTITLPVIMGPNAEYFDKCLIQADLYLRGRHIEYKHKFIRISPGFVGDAPSGDVLFVTSARISRQNFIMWETLFNWLGVTVDYWDTERYNGLSMDLTYLKRHDDTWVDMYHNSLIFYPHMDLSMLSQRDIKTHFYSDSGKKLGSGMLLMSDNPELQDQHNLVTAINQYLTEHEKPVDIRDEFTGKHMFKPDAEDQAETRIKEILKKLEKEDPSHGYIVYEKEINFSRVSSMKYSYGNLQIRRIPIDQGILYFLTNSLSLLDLVNDDPCLSVSSEEIPLGSNFGQMALMTIAASPLRLKSLIMGHDDDRQPVMVTPAGAKFSLKQIAAMSLEDYVCFELMAKPKYPVNLATLYEEMYQNPKVYLDEVVAPYVHLSCLAYLKDVEDCSQACQESAQEIYKKIVAYMRENGVPHSISECERQGERLYKDKDRITLDVLLRTDLLVCPHRFTVKDKMYDLEDVSQDLEQ